MKQSICTLRYCYFDSIERSEHVRLCESFGSVMLNISLHHQRIYAEEHWGLSGCSLQQQQLLFRVGGPEDPEQSAWRNPRVSDFKSPLVTHFYWRALKKKRKKKEDILDIYVTPSWYKLFLISNEWSVLNTKMCLYFLCSVEPFVIWVMKGAPWNCHCYYHH